MPSRNIVITGAGSGIGLAFVKRFLEAKWNVWALDRNITGDLLALKVDETHTVDVTSSADLETFAAKFGDRPLDLLMNNAGITAPKEQDALETVTADVLVRIFTTNSAAPLLLTQKLLPNLLKAPGAKIVNVSSRAGSIGDTLTGGTYAYRASKAALNSISKSMAMDLKDKGITVIIVHPGIVKTAIDPSTHTTPEAVEPEEAAEKLFEIIMSKGIEDTGRFWHREGYEMQW